jgi:Domain of unknown function (DUF4178)
MAITLRPKVVAANRIPGRGRSGGSGGHGGEPLQVPATVTVNLPTREPETVSNDASIVVAAVACLAAAAVAAAGFVAMRRARSAGAPAAGTPARQATAADPFRGTDEDALRGDPRALKPGDIAEVRGRSYAVRGSLRFTEGSWGWNEHLLDDADGHKVWLSVEEDPDLEIVLWTAVPTATVRPGPPTVDFDGRRYSSEESGRARFTGVGTTGLEPAGMMRYHDYAAPDGALLSFESYGDSDRWEVGRGEPLHRSELRIYPQAG